jgi:hypothetical protein
VGFEYIRDDGTVRRTKAPVCDGDRKSETECDRYPRGGETGVVQPRQGKELIMGLSLRRGRDEVASGSAEEVEVTAIRQGFCLLGDKLRCKMRGVQASWDETGEDYETRFYVVTG